MGASGNWQVVLGYHFPYNLRELQSLALGLIIPGQPSLGVSLYQTGKTHLINQQIGINGSISLHQIHFGLRLQYWRVHIPGIESINRLSVALGIQMELADKLLAGIFVSNITNSKTGSNSALPITWHSGIKYKPSSHLNISAELGHTLGHVWHFRTGIEFIIKQKLFVRTGINLSNRQFYLGLGFLMHTLQLDYAIDLHPYLGLSHQAGLGYNWP